MRFSMPAAILAQGPHTILKEGTVHSSCMQTMKLDASAEKDDGKAKAISCKGYSTGKPPPKAPPSSTSSLSSDCNEHEDTACLENTTLNFDLRWACLEALKTRKLYAQMAQSESQFDDAIRRILANKQIPCGIPPSSSPA